MAKGTQILYNDQSPTIDRLNVMIEAMKSGEPLSEVMREEIIDALNVHMMRHANERIKKKGRPIDTDAWLAAGMTQILVSKGGRRLQACARAAAEAISWKNGRDPTLVTAQDVLAVEKNYNKLSKAKDGFIHQRNGNKFCVGLISPTLIKAAQAFLDRKSLDGLSTAKALGTIVLLFDPQNMN